MRSRQFLASLCWLLGSGVGVTASPASAWWQELDLHDLTQHALPAPTQAVVVVFLDPECPVANGYLPVLNSLAREFSPRGIRFLGAYSDPAASLEQLRTHARDFAIDFVTVDDRHQRLLRYAAATYSAETAIFSAGGKLLYRGRIDDRVNPDGVSRPAATHQDLRDTLLKIVAGEPGPFAGRPGYGCSLALPLKSP